MNDELDNDLQRLFEYDSQEFPEQPFTRQTLSLIQQSDLAFKRLKLLIGFLILLTTLIIAPWAIDGISISIRFIVALITSGFFIPVFFSLLAISYLVNKLRIFRFF